MYKCSEFWSFARTCGNTGKGEFVSNERCPVEDFVLPPQGVLRKESLRLAFNGRDLTGWRPSGAASWAVKGGQIIAAPGANGKSGALWTQALYESYLLAVTFQATWPIHAGIWLRAADSGHGPRIEIFDSHKPEAFTGSVSVPGKGLVLVNLREDLIDPEGWNTLSVKVEGDRIAVWLNAEEIGAVRTGGAAKGKIGLYIEGHPATKSAELHVREVLIQHLGEPEENTSTPAQN